MAIDRKGFRVPKAFSLVVVKNISCNGFIVPSAVVTVDFCNSFS
jgi:hypothetical protein